jgi:hypothetical protein
MDTMITMFQWFLIILAADLVAIGVQNLPWKKILKKKRKYVRRTRRMAQVIPFEKRDKES